MRKAPRWLPLTLLLLANIGGASPAWTDSANSPADSATPCAGHHHSPSSGSLEHHGLPCCGSLGCHCSAPAVGSPAATLTFSTFGRPLPPEDPRLGAPPATLTARLLRPPIV